MKKGFLSKSLLSLTLITGLMFVSSAAGFAIVQPETTEAVPATTSVPATTETAPATTSGAPNITAPGAPMETPVGAAVAKGAVKSVETIGSQIFVVLDNGISYYTNLDSDSGKVVLKLKAGDKIIIKYALGTPVKFHDTMATPINNVPNAVTLDMDAITVKPVVRPTDVTVLVNGTAVVFDVKPQIINNSTMVPVRAILEKMGYTLSYDGATGSIKAINGTTEVLMVIGQKELRMGGKTYTALAAPVIIDGRTLIPLRALGEISGYTVTWDDATRTAGLTK